MEVEQDTGVGPSQWRGGGAETNIASGGTKGDAEVATRNGWHTNYSIGVYPPVQQSKCSNLWNTPTRSRPLIPLASNMEN